MEKRMCVLEDNKVCDDCGQCNLCDLDPTKICDNCMKCVNGDATYRSIAIDRIELEQEFEREQTEKH